MTSLNEKKCGKKKKSVVPMPDKQITRRQQDSQEILLIQPISQQQWMVASIKKPITIQSSLEFTINFYVGFQSLNFKLCNSPNLVSLHIGFSLIHFHSIKFCKLSFQLLKSHAPPYNFVNLEIRKGY